MQADRSQPESRTNLALLGAAGGLDLAAHLRVAGAIVADGEPPPDAASPELAARYGCRRLSARMGEVGSLRALRQVVEAAVGATPPASWIWTRADGRLVDGLRAEVEPDGVATREELILLRNAHQAALSSVLAMADEVILLLSGAPCVIDALDGGAYAFAPEPGTRLPGGALLQPHLPELATLDDDFRALHGLLLGLNPRLLLRLVMMPVPVDPLAGAADFATRLPWLRQQSDLRVMMAHWQTTLPHVSYLPIWELCTGPLAQSGDYAPQTSSLTPEGGRQAALLCMGQMPARPPVAAQTGTAADISSAETESRKARRARKRADRTQRDAPSRDVICEEELLEAFSR